MVIIAKSFIEVPHEKHGWRTRGPKSLPRNEAPWLDKCRQTYGLNLIVVHQALGNIDCYAQQVANRFNRSPNQNLGISARIGTDFLVNVL
jgi:hypothetical protein